VNIISAESEELLRVINSDRTDIMIESEQIKMDSSVPFVKFTPSSVPTHDMCVSTGITIATQKPFLEVCQSLGRHMALSGYKPDRPQCFSSYLKELGYQNIVEPIPTLKGKTSISLVSLGFVNCIAVTGKHLYPIVHGCVIDNWDSRKTRVKEVWVHYTELERIFA